MNLRQLVEKISQKLNLANIENSTIEAEILISHVLGKNREFIFAYPELGLNDNQMRLLMKLVSKRLKYIPLAYLTQQRDFYNVSLTVNNNVLIPRPETELIIDDIINNPPAKNTTILDIGTGSGAITISLAKNLGPNYQYLATDISNKALKIAKTNAENHNLTKQITFIKSDLLTYFLKNKSWPYHQQVVIVCNLPYLNAKWRDMINQRQIKELEQEPSLALFSSEDGSEHYRKLSEELQILLKKHPLKLKLYCEISPEQSNLAIKHFSPLGQVKFIKDFSGRERIAYLKS